MTTNSHAAWTVTLQEADDGSNDLVMPLPQDLMDMQGWREGDVLIWAQLDDGRWSLTKKAVT